VSGAALVSVWLGLAAAAAGAPHPGPLPAARGEGDDAPTPTPTPISTAEGLNEIVVTATRAPRPLRDLPTPVTVLPAAELARSPGKTADEVLRAVPSFGLFRRSSSLAADPSSQGVNLRGVGPSGVSRSLVLLDGVPANDPFGGWVYWRALPRLGLRSVEIAPGGASALYGNFALGGVTQLLTRAPGPRALDLLAEGGTAGTAHLAARAAGERGALGVALEAETLRTDGHPVVSAAQRGPVDGDAGADHLTVNGRIEARPAEGLLLRLQAGVFREAQEGGTRFTTAAVRSFRLAATARASGRAGALELTLFGQRGTFEQERARIDPARATEALAARQDVPATDLGAGLSWTGPRLPLLGAHQPSAGVDGRRVEGTTREDLFPATSLPGDLLERDAGGEQRLLGAFVQDVWDLSPAVAVHAAARVDVWQNRDASRTERRRDGTEARVAFPDRTDTTASPKLGLRVRPAPWLALRAAAYRAFRAPTLNELYRPFQVGPVRTDANADLGPELLRGAEAGLDLEHRAGAALRATGFWNVLDGPITNVTVGPNLRERRNLGEARIRGIEVEAGVRIARGLSATAAWTFVEPVVTAAPGSEALVGKDLLQDPRHRVSLAATWERPRVLGLTVHARHVGPQWEDDLNTLRMGGYTVVDLSARRALARGLDLVVAVENLLDREYLVGRAGGLDTVGQPRFARAGLRYRTGP
jgi:outer membrane receptor protein involved in Fe transport